MLCGLLLALFAGGGTSLPDSASGQPRLRKYAIVVSPDVPVTSVTTPELRRILLFETMRLEHGHSVRLVLPAPPAAGWGYLERNVYRSGTRELRRRLLKLQYQGVLSYSPQSLASDREILDEVRTGRSLVGIVDAREIVGTEARVLAVDGKLPSAPGYPVSDQAGRETP